MSDRDELARELFIADNFNQPREQSIVDWQWFMETPRFTVRIERYKAMAEGVIAASYRKPRQITTVEELDALAVRSVVLAHWEDGSQPDYTVMRCAEGGASSSGYGLAGTRHWLGMAKWGATLTVLWEPLP